MKKIIMNFYHWMQHHYLSFRVLVWLKEKGITRKINFLISHSNDRKLEIHPSCEMLKSQKWFEDNHERISNMLSLLCDEYSKKVWNAVILYRTKRIAIDPMYYSEGDQYFVRNIVKLKNGEVFIDGGGYTGDTVQQLLDIAKKEKVAIKQIVVFEPDVKNFNIISKFFGKKKGITLINKGLSDKENIAFFCERGVSSCLTEEASEATVKVAVTNIDAVPECREATFIKMDIEGAEMDALKGARETITKNHPKLAICIYHSDEDMIRIIEYIHDLVPEYKLYVRHHSKSNVETVVYATVD